MVIAIDFDGTCVKHKYPDVGEDIGATQTLKDLVENGYKLILYTMRDGKQLEDAVAWFKERDIPLYGVNDNPEQTWTSSRKIYADWYIDDAALGIPLKGDPAGRPFVDWEKCRELLWQRRFF